MTPAQFSSCKQLLRGIDILEVRNREELRSLSKRRNALQSELAHLSVLIGESNYADLRLLAPMSRRVGKTSEALSQVQKDLIFAHQKELKLNRARQMLVERINDYTSWREEEDLNELLIEMLSSKLHVQPSTS